jgi:elongator complex protein 4
MADNSPESVVCSIVIFLSSIFYVGHYFLSSLISRFPKLQYISMPFVRRTPNAANRPPLGSIPSPSAPSLALISTGVPSFDDILGGGQPVGSILTILAPDEHSAWSKLVERYWIAQGLAADQDVLIIGGAADGNGEGNTEIDELIAGCMWLDEGVAKSARKSFPDPLNQQSAPAEEPDSDAEGLEEESSNRTKIAWRYDKMKKFETTVSGNNSGGKHTVEDEVPTN